MAGCKKKHSALQKAHFKAYAIEGRCGINRLKRLEKYCRNNPNDLQAAEQLKKGNTGYTRKTPKVSVLTKAIKYRLALIKSFCGKGYKELISNDFLTQSITWKKLNSTKYTEKTSKPSRLMMSIGANIPIEIKQQILKTFYHKLA